MKNLAPLVLLLGVGALAQAETPGGVSPAPTVIAKPVVQKKQPLARVKKETKKEKKPKREKETEGTEALDRFKTQGPLESHYTFGGDRLEVDPD